MPPVANFADGPSGLAYYPGTGFGDDFRGRFFLCDFRGASAQSGVRSLRVKPKGAFFEIVDTEQPVWNILATDIGFGPDGGMYISDWVNGWNGEGKGRLYKVSDPRHAKTAVVLDVRKLLGEGMSGKSISKLKALMGHADQRIRLAAQFELAARSEAAELTEIAVGAEQQLARLHGIWGLGQIATNSDLPDVLRPVISLLADPDDEVRAQAAKVLGEARVQGAQQQLIEALADSQPRVQYFAAVAIGRLGIDRALPAVVAMLAANEDRDPIVRHGGIMALVGINDVAAMRTAADHHSRSVRIATVVALRKLKHTAITDFLTDLDEKVVLEAARAIHDMPIPEAYPALAAVIARGGLSNPLMRRVLNANFRMGGQQQANAIGNFAASAEGSEPMRIEALRMLADWEQPSSRDRVLGMWRPLAARDREIARIAIRRALPGIMSGPDAVRSEGAKIAAKLGIRDAGPVLLSLATDVNQASTTRADALMALVGLKIDGLENTARKLLGDEDAVVRHAARQTLAEIGTADAIEILASAIQSGEPLEQQSALSVLAKQSDASADAVIATELDRLLAGQVDPRIQLDILAAGEARHSKEIENRLAKYRSTLDTSDPNAAYRVAFSGGNAAAGKKLFFERTELSCVRCHKIGETGGEVGPNLSKIAADKKRDYLAEAIVTPSKAIAKNFESVMVADADGQIHMGIIKREDDRVLQIMNADGRLISILQDDIEERRPGKSAMPEDLIKHLSRFELRDLIEYLSTLK